MMIHPLRRLSGAAALLAAALLASCESPTGGGVGAPARMDVVAGDLQTATAGAELPDPLVVRVLDDRGHPVRGQIVNFVVTAGGGAVFAGASSTNQQGEARERWTLGTVAGDTQRVEVRAVDAGTGAPQVFATFRAVATAGAAASAARLGNGSYQGTAGMPLADSVAVKVVDRYGNAVAGVEVAWAASPGHGSLSPATSRTDAAGVARSAWTLGTPRTVQLATATVAGLAPDQLSAVAGAGGAARVVITPDSLSFTALRQERPLQAVVYDAFGNVVTGVPVRWTSLDTAVVQVHTDYGVVTAWGPGTGRVVASVVGSEARDTVTVTVTAPPAPPPLMRLEITRRGTYAGPYHTALSDSIRLPVRVLDAQGNPIAGVAVEWTSSDPALARVGPTGYFVPLQPTGTFWATVSLGTVRDSVRVEVRPVRTADRLAGGLAGLCLLQQTGDNWCSVLLGSLADYPRGDSIPGDVVDVAVGYRHLCGLLASGQAYCMGSGDYGQLGDGGYQRMPGDTAGTYAPYNSAGIVPGGLRFTSLAVGNFHSCGVAQDGVLYCWGRGAEGQLGSGVRARGLDPTPVTGSETLRFKAVYAIEYGTCALSTQNTVFCWGITAGGGVVSVPTPVQAPRAFTQLAMGSGFVCALDAGGRAWCWGTASAGQLGNGVTQGTWETAQPVSGGHTFTQLHASLFHACGLTPEGEVRCWGNNQVGQVGTGVSTPSENTPRALVEPRRFTDLAVTGGYTCGLSLTGVPVCWGRKPGYKEGGQEWLPSPFN